MKNYSHKTLLKQGFTFTEKTYDGKVPSLAWIRQTGIHLNRAISNLHIFRVADSTWNVYFKKGETAIPFADESILSIT